jgi:2,3-bisphosphoglycerate-dependent phosphoglycerate mutase
MQLYYIRHAQSENNALWDRTGSFGGRNLDPDLTEVGRCQAELLVDFLACSNPGGTSPGSDLHNRESFGITHLYTSLMLRSVATATTIARRLGLPCYGWKDWHEGGGIYLDDETTGEQVGQPGNNRAFFEAQFPELVLPDDVGEAGWWNRPYEERPERWLRARRVLDELILRHGNSDDRVAVVSHGGFYNYFLPTIWGMDRLEGLWIVMNNAAITRIDFETEEIRLIYTNKLDYLPADLIT